MRTRGQQSRTHTSTRMLAEGKRDAHARWEMGHGDEMERERREGKEKGR